MQRDDPLSVKLGSTHCIRSSMSLLSMNGMFGEGMMFIIMYVLSTLKHMAESKMQYILRRCKSRRLEFVFILYDGR